MSFHDTLKDNYNSQWRWLLSVNNYQVAICLLYVQSVLIKEFYVSIHVATTSLSDLTMFTLYLNSRWLKIINRELWFSSIRCNCDLEENDVLYKFQTYITKFLIHKLYHQIVLPKSNLFSKSKKLLIYSLRYH